MPDNKAQIYTMHILFFFFNDEKFVKTIKTFPVNEILHDLYICPTIHKNVVNISYKKNEL